MKTLAYGLTLLMLMACFSSSALTQNKSAQNSKTASAKSALEYLEDGSALYMKREFENAIKPYQKALDLEKQEPTLEKTLWRVLVVPMRK
jgi:Tfp pilus assembly protein PilF